MWDLEGYIASVEDRWSASSTLLGRSACVLIGVIAVYLLFVLWLGRRLMDGRPPYVLKSVLIIYDFLLIFASAYHVYRMLKIFSWKESSYWCQPMMYDSVNERGIEVYHMVYYFYILKVLNLLETVIFVLRKKWSQVTFLHVFHHVTMVFTLWVALRVYPGVSSMLISVTNALVNTVMYAYYLLSALHLPGVFLIKSYITNIQLMQLVFNIALLSATTVLGFCNRPVAFQSFLVAINVVFYFLLRRFYRKTYRHPGHQRFVRRAV